MMTKKMLLMGILGVSMTAMLHAQVLELKSVEDIKTVKGLKVLEDGTLEVTGRRALFSKNLITVDPAKTYKLSGEFKSGGDQEAMTYLGFQPKDAKGRLITAPLVSPVDGTDTELAEACQAADTQIKVKDASKWKKIAHHMIHFNVKDDLSDLPNTNRINSVIKDIVKEGDIYVITLEKPVNKALEAGTKIRLQSSGGYLYTGGMGKVTGDWKTFSGTIKGISQKGWNPRVWPVGTVSAEIVVLCNWQAKAADEPVVLLVRNVKVEEVE